MAKGAYIGVASKASKIKKGYIGVAGVAHKIKKAYIGIGGVARPCWAGGELTYYGTKNYTVRLYSIAGVSAGKHAIFAGGKRGSTLYGTVYYYNESLTGSYGSSLSYDKHGAVGAYNGSYAVFAGGSASKNANGKYVDVYSNSMVKSPSLTLYNFKTGAATRLNNLALLGGSGISTDRRVVSINTNLTAVESSSNIGQPNSAATVGNYAIFGSIVCSVNESLTITSLGTSIGSNAGATQIENYAIFAGGFDSENTGINNAAAFTTSLTKIVLDNLSISRGNMGATAVENFAIFAGGRTIGNAGEVSTVDCYDSSLTHTVQHALSRARCEIGAATVGNFALFMGGFDAEAFNDGDIFTVI